MSSPVTRKVQYQPEQFLLAVMLLPPACLGETSVTAGSASESLFDDDEYYAWLYGGEEDEITGEELALANLLILWDYNRRSSSGSVTEPWNSSARLRKKYGRQTRPWKVTVPETAILIFLLHQQERSLVCCRSVSGISRRPSSARDIRIVEVRGSTPLCSTTTLEADASRVFFCL